MPTASETNDPIIVLVDPQLGENIGMAARAMLNCGLTHLRIVRPRDGWPSEAAVSAAAGADEVLDNAALFDRTQDAIADLQRLYATTARIRGMTKDIVTPEQAGAEVCAEAGVRTGFLFGGEAKGLTNDDIALADKIIMAPVNPGFTSLNLSQAVLMVAYEWMKHSQSPMAETGAGEPPAHREELLGLFEHLEQALDDSGFLHVREKRPIMARNLRNIWHRAQLTAQEVRTLRGVIASLVRYRPSEPGDGD